MSGAYVVMPAPGDEASLRADVAGIHAFLTAKKNVDGRGTPGRLARKMRFALLPGHDEISTSATFQVHVNLLTYALRHPSYRGAGRINVCSMKTSFEFVTVSTAIVFDVERELELLERCASECSLIAESATDRCAKCEHQALASEYREIAEALRSYRGAAVVPGSRASVFL